MACVRGLTRRWLHPITVRRSLSYYKVIKGVKYDRSALEAAARAVEGRGDGRVSLSDAQELVAEMTDGKGVTKIEFRTAFKILHDYKFTDEAKQKFIETLAHAR